MNTHMRYAKTLLLSAVALWLAGATVMAHEVTFKGTVTAALVEKLTVEVKVTDVKTKKDTQMHFMVTPKTKVLRGDKVVAFKDARIKNGERISVTVNNDVDGHKALVIRLAALP